MLPTSSPDLNQVDYRPIASAVYCRIVYPFRIANVDELKKRLIDEWERQSIVNAAIAEWRRCRLSARVSGADFEYKFQQVYKFSYFVIYLPKLNKLMKS